MLKLEKQQMTGNKAQVLIEKFGKEIPPNMMFEFKSKLLEAEEEEFDVIYNCPVKKKIATILFAIFLGGIGIDRFYIGDLSLGFGKLSASISMYIISALSLSSGALWLIIVALLGYIATAVWQITDIFFSYKKCRYKNFIKLMRVILDKNGRYLDDRILEIKVE